MIETIQSASGLNPQGGLVLYRPPLSSGHPLTIPFGEITLGCPGKSTSYAIYIDLRESMGYSQNGFLRYPAQAGIFVDVYC